MPGSHPSPSCCSFPASSTFSARAATLGPKEHERAPLDLFDDNDIELPYEEKERAEGTQARLDAMPQRNEALAYPAKEDEDGWGEAPFDKHSYLQVFSKTDIEEVEKIYKDLVKEADQRQAIAKVIKRIKETGAYRRLITLPFAWRLQLDRLQAEHPNFQPYFDHLRCEFSIASQELRPLHCEPIALVGPPGIGKSLVAQKVAQMMGTTCTTLRMESAQSSAELAGSADFWSNSKPGRLFEKLVYGESASPVFVLEELEKVSVDRFCPLGPLYALLEADSAAEFHDQAHPWLKMDASQVIWIAACNSVDTLAAPIRSRLTIFDIPAPTPEQTLTIVSALWNKLCSDYPQASSGITLTNEAMEELAQYSPRIIRKALRQALGRALYIDHKYVDAGVVRTCLPETGRRKYCGFV